MVPWILCFLGQPHKQAQSGVVAWRSGLGRFVRLGLVVIGCSAVVDWKCLP